MDYENRRRYTIVDRIWFAVGVSIIYWIILMICGKSGILGLTGVLADTFIIGLAAEFSFELINGRVAIRSNGVHGIGGTMTQIALWPIAKVLELFGLTNQPLIGYLGLILIIIPMIIYTPYLLTSMYYLYVGITWYKMRKANTSD